MARLLLALTFFALAFLSVLRALGPKGSGRRERASGRRPDPQQPRKMVRDPQCGTYLPEENALVERIGEERHAFCSEECRDAWRAER